MRKWIVQVTCIACLTLFSGCSSTPETGPGGSSEGQTGTLSAELSTSPDDGIASVQLQVSLGGAVVASRTIDASASGASGAPLGDAFFVLPPATYVVTATPFDASGKPDQRCTAASTSAVVSASMTTEIKLALVCGGANNGGLDVEVTTEHPPVITNLAFKPSKFIPACEPTEITVTASDPDNEPLSYDWSVVKRPTQGTPTLPPGVTSELNASGSSATFDAQDVGDYTLKVTVKDPEGHAASLSFPTHVLAGSTCKGSQSLSGYLTKEILATTVLGPVPADTPLTVSVGLPIRDSQGLAAFIGSVSNPASANYRQYLTRDQFTSNYGPAASDYQALVDWGNGHGLSVATFANRLLLSVSGSASSIEQAFHVNLQNRKRADGSTFFAPDREPSIDLTPPVLRVSGLENFVPSHLFISEGGVPEAGSGAGGRFQGNDFRVAYAACSTRTGAGQAVGLFELDGFSAVDITTYEANAGIGSIPVNTVLLDSFSGAPSGTLGSAEVALDIEMAAAMAPGLSQIVVFEAPNGSTSNNNDILNRMATTLPLINQLSSSWGFTKDDNTQQVLNELAAQGQSFFQASGDAGAYRGNQDDIRDEQNITVVGGTVLSMSGAGAAYTSESAWGNGGSGILHTPIPSFQVGVDMSTNGGSTSNRNVVDVSMVAQGVAAVATIPPSGSTVAVPGTAVTLQGTSISAPLWAGYMALANEQSVANGLGVVGFANPVLYAIGKVPSTYAASFHDVTSGSDGFNAVAGYDLATGWGSPSCNLINQLASSAPTTSLFNLIEFSITTGNDNLGDHNSAAFADLFAPGASSPFQTITLKPGDGSTWNNGSVHDQTFALSSPQTVGGIDRIVIRLAQPSCSLSCDNWTVEAVDIHLLNSGGPEECLINLSGGPDESDAVARLKFGAGVDSATFRPRTGCM